jgi:hypothetical protein
MGAVYIYIYTHELLALELDGDEVARFLPEKEPSVLIG